MAISKDKDLVTPSEPRNDPEFQKNVFPVDYHVAAGGCPREGRAWFMANENDEPVVVYFSYGTDNVIDIVLPKTKGMGKFVGCKPPKIKAVTLWEE